MKVKTTYLQLFARPERVVPPPRGGLAVVHARKPTVSYYRFLYDAVGRDYDWTSRKKLSDAELAALLNDPRLEVLVLMAEGVPAGLAELDRRVEGEIELVQFGLMPEFIGQGLGRYFLQWAIGSASESDPRCLANRKRCSSPYSCNRRSRSASSLIVLTSGPVSPSALNHAARELCRRCGLSSGDWPGSGHSPNASWTLTGIGFLRPSSNDHAHLPRRLVRR